MSAQALQLGGETDAVPHARRWVAGSLAGSAAEAILPDVELVVTELVTNALLHAGPPITVHVDVQGDTVRIGVADSSRAAPVRALARADAMTGRGLSLVAALSRDWGVRPAADGKVVWCELGAEPVAAPDDVDVDVDALLAAWDDGDTDLGLATDERHYDVTLGDVPTDLLLAAKAHVDNLVREFTLAARGAASGRSAEVPPQLAELIEEVVSGFAEARLSIKRQAVEAGTRGADRTTLNLSLPVSAADAGERYLAALDEADAYARAARLLTLEPPPQHRVFRRWYVESLVVQLRQAAAGETPRLPMTFERRVLQELDTLASAQRASERAARLQSVTAALAATMTVPEVAQVVVREGVDALGASGGVLVMPGDDDHLTVPAAVGYGPTLIDRLRTEHRDAELPAALALRTGQGVWLESPQERDARFPELVGIEPGVLSICAIPLCLRDEVVGALRFSFDTARLFDSDERRFVEALAAQTTQALDRARALEEARAASEKLSFLADASAALAASLDYRTTLRNVCDLAVPRLADWCAVHVVTGDALDTIAVAHVDRSKESLAAEYQRRYPARLDDGGTVAGVVATGQSVYVPYVTDEMVTAAARDAEHLALTREIGLSSVLVVALTARDRIFGALTMCHAESGRHYDQRDLELAEDLAHRAALAIDNATLFRELSGG